MPWKFPPLPEGEQHTMETIRARCVEEGDCLIWQGGKAHGSPYLMAKIDGKRKSMAVRRYIAEVLQGRTVPPGRVVSMGCDCLDCVNPDHIRVYTRQQLVTRSANRTRFGEDPARKAKISAKKREQSKLTWNDVQEIRASSESSRTMSRRTGIPFATIQGIRAYRTWVDHASVNPFSQLIRKANHVAR